MDPYATPLSNVVSASDVPEEPEPTRLRREHLPTEKALQSLATTLLAVGLLGVVLGVALGTGRLWSLPESKAFASLVPPLWYLYLGSLLAVVGWNLRQLRVWVRPWAMFSTAVLAVLFPVGTFLSLAFGWRLLTSRGSFVLSEEYALVREATPELTAQTSSLFGVWFIVFVVGVVIFVAVSGLL
jgi:hypothetical protein